VSSEQKKNKSRSFILIPQREIGSQKIEEFFGGTGVSPLLTQAKACGYRKYHWNANPYNLSEQLTMTSKKCLGAIPLLLLTAHCSLLTAYCSLLTFLS
jgi:hypothetical protein